MKSTPRFSPLSPAATLSLILAVPAMASGCRVIVTAR